jgi:autotransporter-associated beta strand protein
LQVSGANNTSKVFDLTGNLTGGGTVQLANSPAMTLRFNGTTGDADAIFNLGTAPNFASVRNNATAITLGGLVGGPLTTLQGNGSFNTPMTFTVGGANADTEFDGVIANGGYTTSPAVSLIKTGRGTQTFTGVNTYSGGTTIDDGVLQINNLTGSGTGSGGVIVANDGTLAGNGIISGAVTINSGGMLAPGNPLGALTINNNLTLASGSTTLIQIQSAPVTNNFVNVSGTLTENGTLTVTNISATPFVAGNHFKLFNAANCSGSFVNFILPSLATNLVWNTSQLNVDGSLWIVSTAPPNIAELKIAGTNLMLNGTGGTPDWNYHVLTCTNLLLPVAQWACVATNQFDGAGNFNFTNAINTSLSATYYRIQSP